MKWIKKIWNSFVRWFKGLFKKKYSTVKPSGCVSLYTSSSSTGINPQWEQYFTRRSALYEQIKLIGKKNTYDLIDNNEELLLDLTVEHNPTTEKTRSFIRKKAKVRRIVVRKISIPLFIDDSGSIKQI